MAIPRLNDGGDPARGATSVALSSQVAVADEDAVYEVLGAEPGVVDVINEAADQLVRFIPDARLRLKLLVDPEEPEDVQLFLGASTSLRDREASEALRRFDQEWWVPNVRRARGLLCIDLRDE